MPLVIMNWPDQVRVTKWLFVAVKYETIAHNVRTSIRIQWLKAGRGKMIRILCHAGDVKCAPIKLSLPRWCASRHFVCDTLNPQPS